MSASFCGLLGPDVCLSLCCIGLTRLLLPLPHLSDCPLVSCSDAVAPTLKALGVTPLMAAVLVGAAQNVFSKSAKYSLFDPCKEMAYIPLDDEVRLACRELSCENSMSAGLDMQTVLARR